MIATWRPTRHRLSWLLDDRASREASWLSQFFDALKKGGAGGARLEGPRVPNALQDNEEPRLPSPGDRRTQIVAAALELLAEGDVAGATGDIDKALARARFERSDELSFPPAVDTAAHQVVHQVVARGDIIEEGAYQRRLFVRGHAAGAEIGVAACVFLTHRAGR